MGDVTGDDISAQWRGDLGRGPADIEVTAPKLQASLLNASGLGYNPDEPTEAPSAEANRSLRTKRAMDVGTALMLLLALLPLFVIVALVIKFNSKGPVFFRQIREGIGGKPFRIYKFRTMSLAHCDPSGVVQTRRNDARVTAVGYWLRRLSIDELPQLLNVLIGDMSLVGPRPHVPGMLAAGRRYDDLMPIYYRRYRMLPGITGWAQANGLRGPTDDARLAIARVEHDIAYIQNYSLWLDLRILLLTVKKEFLRGTGD